MARKKKPPPLVVRKRPGVTVGRDLIPVQPGRPDSPVRILPTAAPGSILVASDDPVVDVIALANTTGVTPVDGGGARHRISERIWQTSVPQYEGHDPFRVSVSLILTGFRTQTRIDTQLEALYLLGTLKEPDRTMPLIRLGGQVHARWARRTWLMDGPIQWDDTPGIVAVGDGHYQLPVTFTLLERVQDQLLQNSISKSRKGGGKNGPRTHVVKKGENDYGDVSKAEFGTRSRAAEIARANNESVAAKLRVGRKLRLP